MADSGKGGAVVKPAGERGSDAGPGVIFVLQKASLEVAKVRPLLRTAGRRPATSWTDRAGSCAARDVRAVTGAAARCRWARATCCSTATTTPTSSARPRRSPPPTARTSATRSARASSRLSQWPWPWPRP
eukprot:scaffold1852_cov282-Prasinococcus_capsulatus_cf.AAC.2